MLRLYPDFSAFKHAVINAEKINVIKPTLSWIVEKEAKKKAAKSNKKAIRMFHDIQDNASKEEKHKILKDGLKHVRECIKPELKMEDEENSIYIEESFSAISDSKSLNTDNIISCIFLVITNNENNVTFAAHINSSVSSDSIKKAITEYNELSKVGATTTLTCHLIGGNSSEDTLSNLKAIYDAIKLMDLVLGKCLITLTDSWKRVAELSYNPITKEFYHAIFPLNNKLRKMEFIRFSIDQCLGINKGVLHTIAICVNGDYIVKRPIITDDQITAAIAIRNLDAYLALIIQVCKYKDSWRYCLFDTPSRVNHAFVYYKYMHKAQMRIDETRGDISHATINHSK